MKETKKQFYFFYELQGEALKNACRQVGNIMLWNIPDDLKKIKWISEQLKVRFDAEGKII